MSCDYSGSIDLYRAGYPESTQVLGGLKALLNSIRNPN